MAGRPARKAREAEEAERGRGRSKRRFSDSEKRVVLKQADEVGAGVAARQVGVSPGTLRTWRARLGDVPEPVAGGEPTSRAAVLRARADGRRRAQYAAEDRAESQIASDRSSEARNSMVTAASLSDRARELEDSARSQESHESAVAQAQGERIVALLEAVFGALGLPLPELVLRYVLQGEPVPDEAAGAERELVLGPIRAEAMRAARAEAERGRFVVGDDVEPLPAAPAVEPAAEASADLPFGSYPDERDGSASFLGSPPPSRHILPRIGE
jgi:hypothetical protein